MIYLVLFLWGYYLVTTIIESYKHLPNTEELKYVRVKAKGE